MKKNKEVVYSNPGTKLVNRYIRLNDDNGVPCLNVKEQFNLYEDIQSYKDDNDIYKILARVSGDISKLDFNKGVYLDVSKIPDNYNDFMNLNFEIKNDYERLPLKYKELLKNNYNLFYGLAMQGKIKDFIDFVDKDDIESINKTVKSIDFNFNDKKNDFKNDESEVVKND